MHAIGDDSWLNPDRIVDKIRITMAADDYQPPMLPAVALELIALSSNPDVPLGRVRDLIQSEPMIAGKVLSLAQSALYARGGSITSLEEAITRLGLRTLTQLFLQVSMTLRVFRAKGYEGPMHALRRHAVVTAHAARMICRRTGFPDEYAFLGGLLHDVGAAAGILIVADTERGRSVPSYELLEPCLQAIHAEASGVVARLWQLPSDLGLVLQHHHAVTIDGRVHPLVLALGVADWLAAELGAGFGTEVDSMSAQRAVHELRLEPRDLQAIEQSLEPVLESE